MMVLILVVVEVGLYLTKYAKINEIHENLLIHTHQQSYQTFC